MAVKYFFKHRILALLFAVSTLATFAAFAFFSSQNEPSGKWPTYYTIEEVCETGRILVLNDGTRFTIPPPARAETKHWERGDPIKLLHSKEGKLQILHTETHRKVEPLCPHFIPPRHESSLKIASIREDRKEICLREGFRFSCRFVPDGWKKGMSVLLIEESDEALKLYTPYFPDGLVIEPILSK